MDYQKSASGFTVPRQTLDAGTEVPITVSGISTWRADLPLADMGNSAKRVFQILTESNIVRLSAQERFEILELFRPPMQYIYQGLRKHYLNQTQPLNDKKLKIAHLVRLLVTEMINGYKSVIVTLLQAENKADLKALLPQAIFQALNYINHLFLHHYQLYSQPSTQDWTEVHLLYKLAEDAKIATDNLKGEQKNNQLNSIEAAYLRILVMRALNPYQWRQSDQDAFNRCIPDWLEFVDLKTFEDRHSSQHNICVYSQEGGYPALGHALSTTSNVRSLMMIKLTGHLEKLHASLSQDEMDARLSHQEAEYALSTYAISILLQQLTQGLTALPAKQESPVKMECAFGLGAAHYYLNNNQEFAPPGSDAAAAAIAAATPKTGLSLAQEDAPLEAESIDFSNLTLSSSPVATKAPTVYPLYLSNLARESGRQAYLEWEDENHLALQPGELLIARAQNQQGPWRLACVRELMRTEDGMRLKLDWLSPSALPGSIQLIKNNQPAGYYLRCLFLANPFSAEQSHLKPFPNIVCPTLPFKAGHEASLVFKPGSPAKHIKLNQLVENTNNYKQFIITEIVDAVQEAPQAAAPVVKEPTKPKADSNGEFDSIWSSL